MSAGIGPARRRRPGSLPAFRVIGCLALGLVLVACGRSEPSAAHRAHALGMASLFVDHGVERARRYAHHGPMADPGPVMEGGQVHRVLPGERLEGIALAQGCAPAELLVHNRLRSDALWAGQVLRLPRCAGEASETGGAPSAGAVLSGLAGTPVDLRTHVVRPGEYLTQLGARHGCSVREIAEASGLWGDVVHPGTLLRIPDCASGEPVTTGVGELQAQREADRLAVRSGQRRVWRVHHDGHTLPVVLAGAGGRAAEPLALLVVEVDLDGRPAVPVRERWYHWNVADNRRSLNLGPLAWWPVIHAAGEILAEQGIGPEAEVSLEAGGPSAPAPRRVEELLGSAFDLEDALALSLLISLVGQGPLHAFLKTAPGRMMGVVVRHAPELEAWMAAGGASSYAGAPALRVRTASGERLLERRHWEGGEGCPAGVCASLQDVAEGVLRLVHGPVSGDVSEAEPGEGAWPWRAVPSGRPPEGLGQDLGRALRGSHELVLAHRVVPSASEEVVADVAVLRARRQERVWVVVAVARPVVLDGLTRPLARVLGEGRVTRL